MGARNESPLEVRIQLDLGEQPLLPFELAHLLVSNSKFALEELGIPGRVQLGESMLG